MLALLSKQISITIPPLLFLIEWWSSRQPFDLWSSIRRYALFVAAAVGFSLLQYLTQSTHTFASVFGWQFGASMAYILLQYLVLFFLPWGSFPSIDLNQVQVGAAVTYAWVAVAVVIYAYVTWRSRSRTLLVLAAFTLMNLLPVLPFPFIENRYLYLPIMAAALILALLFTWRASPWALAVASRCRCLRSVRLSAWATGLAINDSALSRRGMGAAVPRSFSRRRARSTQHCRRTRCFTLSIRSRLRPADLSGMSMAAVRQRRLGEELDRICRSGTATIKPTFTISTIPAGRSRLRRRRTRRRKSSRCRWTFRAAFG